MPLGVLGSKEAVLGQIVLGSADGDLTFVFNESITLTDEMVGTNSKGIITESINFSDTMSYKAVFHASFSDTLTFTDAAHRAFLGNWSDTLTFSDTETQSHWVIGNASDTLSLTESLLEHLIGKRTIAEAVVFTETLSKTMVKLLALSETVNFVETLNGVAVKVLGDSFTFSDAITFFVSKLLKDTVEFGDILSLQGVFKRNIADTIVLFDSLQMNHLSRVTMSDSLTLNETMSGYIVRPLVPDHVTFTETVSATVSKPLNDTLAFTDTFTFNKSVHLGLSDTVVFADNDGQTSLAKKVLRRQIIELLNFIETMKGVRQRFGTMNDSFTFTDKMLRAVNVRTVFDTITFSDSLTYHKVSTRKFDENLVLADTLNLQARFNRTFNESLTLYDGFLVKVRTNNNIQGEGIITNPVVQGVIRILPQLVLKGFSRSIVLPPPEFNDFVAGQSKVAVQRSMTGSIRVYAKRADREKLNFHFTLPKYKADEFKLFLQDEINNPIDMLDWNGDAWHVKILSNSVDFVENRRWSPCGNAVDVTVEFVGTRYA
jgi:hypothetical protein